MIGVVLVGQASVMNELVAGLRAGNRATADGVPPGDPSGKGLVAAIEFEVRVGLTLVENPPTPGTLRLLLETLDGGLEALVPFVVANEHLLPDGPWYAMWMKGDKPTLQALGAKSTAYIAARLARQMANPEGPPPGLHMMSVQP